MITINLKKIKAVGENFGRNEREAVKYGPRAAPGR